jgi:ketosteroid isomerase-like protein
VSPPPGSVEVVRAIHEAWLAGRSAGAWIADDFEYVNPDYAVETGTRRGKDSLLGVLDVYADFKVAPERYVDAGGGKVVMLGDASGTGASGAEIRWKMGYVWTVENGRATSLRWFNDQTEALAAARVSG